MEIQIKPTGEQLKMWVEGYIPEKDFFFVDENMVAGLEEELSGAEIFTRTAFFETREYDTLDLNNSLMYWALSKEVSYVVIAPAEWLSQLSLEKQVILLTSQTKMRQGMIFPSNIFPSSAAIPDHHLHAGYVVVQRGLWESFSFENQVEILSNYAQLWDGWTAEPLPEQSPLHLAKYANTFNATHHGNCLAATIFAMTSDEDIIQQWLSQEDFVEIIKSEGYQVINEKPDLEDISVWVNENEVIQHAAFYLGNSLYFNKNGQTYFNPWTICKEEQLCKEWEHLDKRTYRRRVE
ncbi:hypothetical protein [Jeotgalibacillus sp. R-1-5s-1]|uniref:hypothetical protein n=1 Tax=Jeotgalibacillus sp. R-1-5s-1 TaxID=2555897 RepID=UPI00106CA041|nr:hypothetical protein [Jeotgalibacillus sp. R-1-5s-1]TFD94422.1 hypothetical protein E2491_13370 [Jeotgalibacillus sp. R-1-5s-1]